MICIQFYELCMPFKKRISVVFINIFKSTVFINSNLKIVGFKRTHNFFNKSIHFIFIFMPQDQHNWNYYNMYLHKQQYM